MKTQQTITVPIEVRFKDIDILGHVNNAAVITYFEEGRKQFFIKQMQKPESGYFNFILAHVSCDYYIPIQLDDQIELHMWIEDIGNKSFRIGYQIQDSQDPAKIFAKGHTVQVCYDYEQTTSTFISDTMRSVLEAYQR